jgi:ABC-type Fe3+/spermidine/putrescine transport system ATPase subunit
MSAVDPEVARSCTPALALRDVALAYRGHEVLSHVDLEVTHGEIIAVIGPSGSGKSSLLRCLGGFLDPIAGTVHIDGRLIADQGSSMEPERREVGFVFQNHALWPHMTVRENVAYPWRIRRVSVKERTARAEELLVQVGLDGLGDRKPSTLSGGQQQRVALARGLAGDPRLLLLDEPLSSVDAARRDELQSLISDVVRSRGLTTIITTHDQREAMTLADRIVVLGEGTIAQCATPIDLHERPANGFVARFMGALNVFDVRISSLDGTRLVAETLDGKDQIIIRACEVPTETAGVLVARPEAIQLTAPGNGDQDGEVVRSVLTDGRTEVRVQVGGMVLRVFEQGVPFRLPGDRVGLIIDRSLVLATETKPAST